MTTTSIAQTLGSVRNMLDASAENLQRLNDPDARKLDASMSANRIGSSGSLRTHVKLSRNINPLQEKAYIEQVTVLEGKNTKTNFLSEVQSIIGGGDGPQKSRLVTTIDEFFQSAKNLESNVTNSMRQAFVDKAENVSATLTGASDKITDLRLDTDNSLKNGTISANNTIKSLFQLNNEMLRSSVPIKLHDQRDALVRDLAKNFDIKVSYGSHGIAQVISKASGELLVSNDAYSQFTYDGVLSKDIIIDNNNLPALTICQFDKEGNSKSSRVFAGGSGDASKAFSGGKWSALIELRDKTLLEISGAIKTLTSNFTKQINEAHNSGSPYPPKGLFESTIEVSGNQAIDHVSPFTIYALDEKGKQLIGGAGKLNPVTINMQNLRASGGGTPTVADLIAELNQKLDMAPSRERAAMGAILDKDNQQIPGEYLLNNIQLKANSSVAGNNNSFTFELDLQGNSHFGSKIEVLSVQTTDAGGANAQPAVGVLPGAFTLDKDKNVATNQPITVTGAGAGRLINVEIRITGDNGVMSTGTVSFRADAAVNVNDRIAFDSTLVGGVADGFNHAADNPVPVLTSHSGVAKARLVDSNGVTVDPASGLAGKLVIESNNPDYRMVFQGGNLGAEFGFNDLFKYDARTGALEVKQAIIDDVNQLAIAQVQKNAGDDVAHIVGDAQASGELAFDFNAGGLAANDTVTIDGVAFTFAAAPANGALQVLVGGDNAASLTNLRNKINAHSAFDNRIVAEFDGGNNLKIKAFTPGTSGNDIQLSINLPGGATANYTPGVVGDAVPVPVAPLNNNVLAPLAGGTNKTAIEKVFSYNLEPNNKDMIKELSDLQSTLVAINAEGIIPESLASLAGLATIVTGLLSNYASDAEMDSRIADTVLKQTDKLIKETSGIQREPEYLRALDLAQLMNALAHLLSMIQSSNVKTQDIIFG
jgi:flagellar hook-associated protein FlgK